VYLWPFLKSKEAKKIAESNIDPQGLAYSANGKKLNLIGTESLCQFDMATKKQKAKWDLPAPMLSSTFSHDGKLVISSEWPGDTLFFMEVDSGRLLRTIRAPNTEMNIAALSSDGRILATCQMTNYRHEPLKLNYSIRLWEILTGKEILQFHSSQSSVYSLAFSADGHSLISGMNNGTALIWNMKPALGTALLARDFEAIWADLPDENAAKAHKAIWTLVAASKQSVPFLRDRLKPNVLADQIKIQKWIADLDSETFTVRQAAAQELVKVGDQVQPPIQKALQGTPSLETRRRLEQILKNLADIPGPETIRTIRAIMALERIATPEARGVLEALAGGAPGARETEEARASLERLKGKTYQIP
jgi:hypothetical protein